MPRYTSEILESFAKALEKSDLTKLAADEHQKYKDDAEARMGSDSVSDIEVMYGVKPDTAEKMQYEQNIMQIAHPNSVIIAPSYDRMNGLVENNMERSRIMQNIVYKPTTGNHTNPKYAHRELLLELVRIANEMDNKNKAELFSLADECLVGLHKEAFELSDITDFLGGKARDAGAIGEGALAGAGIGATIGGLLTSWTGAGVLAGVPVGAATGAVAGAVLAAFTKTEGQVKNVALNAKEVSEQLKDLRGKIPEDEQFFTSIDTAILALIDTSSKYQDAIKVLKEHAISGQSSDADQQAITEATKNFLANVALIKKLHAEFARRVQSGEFAKAKPHKALTPLYWFMDDDIEDVEDAFNVLEEAIHKLEEATKQNVGAAVSEAKQDTASPSASNAVGAPAGVSVEKPAEEEGFDFLKYLQKSTH